MAGHRPWSEASARVRARPGAAEQIARHAEEMAALIALGIEGNNPYHPEEENMDDEQQDALRELKAQVKLGGRLKIITATFADKRRTEPSVDPADYVQHEVTRIEGPNAGGLVAAVSEEGDMTVGEPTAVLHRLRQWRPSQEDA